MLEGEHHAIFRSRDGRRPDFSITENVRAQIGRDHLRIRRGDDHDYHLCRSTRGGGLGQ